jgi:hypothetical protein
MLGKACSSCVGWDIQPGDPKVVHGIDLHVAGDVYPVCFHELCELVAFSLERFGISDGDECFWVGGVGFGWGGVCRTLSVSEWGVL